MQILTGLWNVDDLFLEQLGQLFYAFAIRVSFTIHYRTVSRKALI